MNVSGRACPRKVGVMMPVEWKTTRILWSLAFVWPKGITFTENVREGRKGPAWYARCIADLIGTRSRERADDSFIVFTHGAISTLVLDALQVYWKTSLVQGGCGTLSVMPCDPHDAPFFPVMQRTIPVIEKTENLRIVIAVDVHDDLNKQAREVTCMLSEMAKNRSGLGLTFYQAIDDSPDVPKTGLVACYEPIEPENRSTYRSSINRPTRAAVANRRQLQGIQWCIDAGLLASTSEWRIGLSKLIGPASHYNEHVSNYHRLVGIASSHSDELALSEFLLEGTFCSLKKTKSTRLWLLDYVRKRTTLRSHVLCTRSSRNLPPLSRELRKYLGVASPNYTGKQLSTAMGAPDEDIDALDLKDCQYARGVSEKLVWSTW